MIFAIRHWAVFAAAATLSACAVVVPPQESHTFADNTDTPAAVSVTPEPKPAPSADTGVAELRSQLQLLQQQVAELQQQTAELQRQHTALSQIVSLNPPRSGRSGDSTAAAAEGGSSRLQQARQQYAAGLYSQAVRTLAGSDGGGDGSADAQNSMYLLMQSHWRLNNCESVINVGNRFANRFARNPQAAEALWLVSQCQWRMQQQDIARDTWRKIIRTYPDSGAAKRAQQRLHNGR